MLGQQTFAQMRNRASRAGIAACFEREIAFGVDAERAVGEIRGADDDEVVVDDGQLAVHVEARHVVVEPRQYRRVKSIAPVTIGFAKRAVIARAEHAHRGVLEPAALNVGR